MSYYVWQSKNYGKGYIESDRMADVIHEVATPTTPMGDYICTVHTAIYAEALCKRLEGKNTKEAIEYVSQLSPDGFIRIADKPE